MLSLHTVYSNNIIYETKRDNRGNDIKSTEDERSMGGKNTSVNSDTGTSYLQTEIVSGFDRRVIAHNRCDYYNCGKKGHYVDNCPNATCTIINDRQHAHMSRDNDRTDNITK